MLLFMKKSRTGVTRVIWIAAGMTGLAVCILAFFGGDAEGKAKTKFGTLNLRWGEKAEADEGETIRPFMEVRLDGDVAYDYRYEYIILCESVESAGNSKVGVRYFGNRTDPYSASALCVGWLPEDEESPLSVAIFKYPDDDKKFEMDGKLTGAWVEGKSFQEIADMFSSEEGEGMEYEIGIRLLPDRIKLKPGEARTPYYYEERNKSWYWKMKERLHRWRNN